MQRVVEAAARDHEREHGLGPAVDIERKEPIDRINVSGGSLADDLDTGGPGQRDYGVR